MPSSGDQKPPDGSADPQLWRIASVAIIGSFLSQMDATVVNVSLSSLAVDLHTSLSTIQWVTSGYLLALALTLPLSGWLVDRIGAKAVYIWCFSAFTLTSALCGLAWSANSLIVFRVLQGMSGGLMAPMAQLIMVRAAGDKMARVFGIAAMPILLAPLLGPVVAGALLKFASWRWLFLINLPFGVLAIVLAALFLPHDRDERKPRDLDLFGLVLLSPGVALFLYGSDHMSESEGIAAIASSTLLLIVFFWWAIRKKDEAIIDLRLLTIARFPLPSLRNF
jgi:EmrB/QacA subfamily drug resistance transporter